MPWPGTNIRAPWDPEPAPAAPDTTQRDALVKTLTAQHGGQVGAASTPMVKNPKDPGGPDIPGPYDLYTFADGTSVEVAPTGEVSKYTVKTPTGTSGWTDITQVRNADQSITFYGKDPKDPGGPLKPVEGLPPSAAPESVKTQPSKLEDLRKIDADGNDAAKTGKPAAKLYDDKTGQSYPVDKDKPSYTSFGDDLVQINPDGTTKTLLSKPDKPSTVTVPGVGLVEYDPTTHTAKTIAAAPKGLQANQVQPQVSNGKTYIPYDTDEGVKFKEAEGLPENVTWTSATNDPRSKYIQLIGSNGETKNIEKPPDWKPPPSPQAGQALTPDTTSPFVVTIGDNGQPTFTENKNRQTISEAQKNLIQQLGGKVADGSMTEQQAKDLIASTTQAMTAQASQQNAAANMLQAQTQQQQLGVTAANNALTQIQNAAQTGAGLLQNRVTAGTGALNNAISAIAGSKMTSAPAGMGANLTGGLSEWVTQLGGGQPVYDSAAAMVNNANPSVKGDPNMAQQAYTALRGAMDLYKQQTGQDWQPKFNAPTTTGGTVQTQPQAQVTNVTPNAAATAANQTNQFGFNPQASTAALNAQGFQDTPQGRAAAAQVAPAQTATPFVTAQYQPGVYGPLTGTMPALQPLPIPPTAQFRAPVTA
jgi:hypothetical protein